MPEFVYRIRFLGDHRKHRDPYSSGMMNKRELSSSSVEDLLTERKGSRHKELYSARSFDHQTLIPPQSLKYVTVRI